jgi:hypothetical protein
MAETVELTRQDQETWTTLKVILRGDAGWFYLYKLTRGGVTVCAASPAAARARLAARLAAGT